jgi:hypothetical protein
MILRCDYNNWRYVVKRLSVCFRSVGLQTPAPPKSKQTFSLNIYFDQPEKKRSSFLENRHILYCYLLDLVLYVDNNINGFNKQYLFNLIKLKPFHSQSRAYGGA